MKPLNLLLICLLCASCSTINQNRQDSEYQSNFEKNLPKIKSPKSNPDTATSANYETYLNEEFFKQCQDCKIIKSKYIYNPSKSYIPAKLQRNIPLSDKVVSIDYNMNDLLLCYFTNDSSLNSILIMDFNALDSLMKDVEPLVDSKMRQNFNYYQYDFVPSYIYTRSCSGYLNALLEMGVKPPMSSIESTLTAEEQNNSVITILYGTYTSALAGLLSGNENPLSKYLYFKLYDIYNLKGQQKNLYYLKSFTGMSYNRITDQNTIRNLANKIGLNVSIPIPQVMTNVSSNANIKTVLENKEYFFGSFPKTLIDFSQKFDIDQLPDKEAVKKAIESIEVTPTNTTIKPVSEGRVYTYEFEIKGVPANRCYHSYWRINLDANSIFKHENIRFDIQGKKEPDETDSINVCKFKVYLNPKTNLKEDEEVTFNITYQKENSCLIKHEVSIPVSKDPTFELVNPTSTLRPIWENNAIKWSDLIISAKDGRATITSDMLTITEAYYLSDPNNPTSKIQLEASVASVDGKKDQCKIKISLQQPISDTDRQISLNPLKTTKGVLKIKYKKTEPNPIERSVEFNIGIPNQLSK